MSFDPNAMVESEGRRATHQPPLKVVILALSRASFRMPAFFNLAH